MSREDDSPECEWSLRFRECVSTEKSYIMWELRFLYCEKME